MRTNIMLALLLTALPITATAQTSVSQGLISGSNLLLDYKHEERQQRIADQQIIESQQRMQSGNELRSVDDPRWGTMQEAPRRSSTSQWHRAFEAGTLPAQQRAVDQMNQNHHDGAWDY